MKHLHPSFVLICLIMTLPIISRACFMMIPLEELVKSSPVIVSGKITAVTVSPQRKGEGPQLQDTGFLRVDRVLKNTLKDFDITVGDRLPLKFPSQNRIMHISTDIVYRKGQEGVWILDYRDGAFYATYPGDLQSLDQLTAIENLVPTPASP